MRRILILAALSALPACTMQCGPAASNGYTYCQPATTAPPSPDRYSYVPSYGAGYAPAYPPYERHEWVADAPHYEMGD